jgi:sugar/nucleoside kinase (ribokinase family)
MLEYEKITDENLNETLETLFTEFKKASYTEREKLCKVVDKHILDFAKIDILPKNPIFPEQIDIELKEISNVLLSPLSPYDIPIETITFFKENNIRTILIPQGLLRQTDENNNVIERNWNDIDKYLKDVDIICLDENEAKKAFNLGNINDELILEILKKHNLEQIIITKAERGSTIYTESSICNIPAIKTKHAIDATGLGDTYIAAYIAKFEESHNEYESGLFAAITAKEKLENKGPLKSSKEKIEKELDKHRQ